MKKIIFLILLLSFNLVLAQEQIQRDVSAEILLAEQINVNETYKSFIKLENLDHVTGQTDSLKINVSYYISNLSINKSYIKQINKYSTSGASINISSKGKFELCVDIQPLNFKDFNVENNNYCKDLYVGIKKEEKTNPDEDFEEKEKDASKEDEHISENCDCNLSIKSDKQLYAVGEKVDIDINYCVENNSFQSPITYWIENQRSQILKSKLNTTSTTKKSYTIKEQATHILKAHNENCGLSAKYLFGSYDLSKKDSLEFEIPKTAPANTVQKINIKGYKKDTNKKVLNIWLEDEGEKISDYIKLKINKKNIEYDFELPLKIPKLNSGVYDVVLEGLDNKISKRLYVQGYKDKKEEKEELIGEEAAKIKNFYTRKQLFDKNVKFFLTTTKTTNSEFKIYSSKKVYEGEITGNMAQINMSISYPDEIIIAQLIKNNKTLDTQFLILNLTKEDKKEKKLQKTDSGADSAQNLTNEPVTVSSIKKQESNASYIALSLIVLTFLIIIKTFLNEKNYHYLYEKIRNKRIFR